MEKIREFWGRHHLWSYVRQVKPLMALISPFFLDELKLYRNMSHIHKTESKRWNMRREHFQSDLVFFRGFRRFYTNTGGSASWTLEPPKSPTSTYRKSIIGITNAKPNNEANRSFPPKSQEFSTEIEHPYVIFSQAQPMQGNWNFVWHCLIGSIFFWARGEQLYARTRTRFTVNLGVCPFFFFLPLQSASENAWLLCLDM